MKECQPTNIPIMNLKKVLRSTYSSPTDGFGLIDWSLGKKTISKDPLCQQCRDDLNQFSILFSDFLESMTNLNEVLKPLLKNC